MKLYPWATAAILAAGALANLTPASAGGLTACVGAHVSATGGEAVGVKQNCANNIYDNMQAGGGSGSGNAASVSQHGGSNSAAIGQTGNGNAARLKQLGF